MSKRNNSIPNTFANCRVTSVLPTPVGPANKKHPTGFCGSRKPERANLIAEAKAVMAAS